MEIKSIKFSCCFCNKGTEELETATFTVDAGEFSQTWWGHLSCFKKALHPQFRVFRPEFEDDPDKWELDNG